MVMICSIIVIFTDPRIAKFVDPGVSIISAAILLYLKYPNSEWFYHLKNDSPVLNIHISCSKI